MRFYWITLSYLLFLLLLCNGANAQLTYLYKSDLAISTKGIEIKYHPGDYINVQIIIMPINDNLAKKMENRDYTFYNYLDSPRNMEVTFVSRETYVEYTRSTNEESLTIKDYEISSGYGVGKIEINVSGYVPSIEGGIEEFTFFKIVPEDGDTLSFNITVEHIKPYLHLIVPSDSEYRWFDISNNISSISIQGNIPTGLSGKVYAPVKIRPNRTYPIYILVKKDQNVSTMSIAGLTLCLTPAFDIDIPNKYIDLYLHFGIGCAIADIWKKHWFIVHLYDKKQEKRSYTLSYSIRDISSSIKLSNINSKAWNVYKIDIKISQPKEIVTILSEPLDLSVRKSYNGFWQTLWGDNLGIWIEDHGDATFLVGVYQREFNRLKACVGPSIVVGEPSEIGLHIGIGFGKDEKDWDEIMYHISLPIIVPMSSKKPHDSDWDRIDWFEVKLGTDGYIKHIETDVNGYLNATALSDEREVEWIDSVPIYSVKINGTFEDNYGYKKNITATLYYVGSKSIKQGDIIKGYVKLITLRYLDNPITYLSAVEEGYWVYREPTLIPTPLPTPIPPTVNETVRLVVSKKEVAPREKFTLNIYVKGATTKTVLMNFTYPGLISVEDTKTYGVFNLIDTVTQGTGYVKYLGVSTTPVDISSGIKVVTITFKVNPNAKPGEVINFNVTTATIDGINAVVSSTPVKIVKEPWQRYDKNGNGRIDDLELLQSIQDWLNNKIPDLDLLNIIMKWLKP